MLDLISQVAIAILGISSIVLVARKNRLGFVLGLVAQPFYYYTCIQNHQWGLLVATTGYTISWIYGIRQWYSKKERNAE